MDVGKGKVKEEWQKYSERRRGRKRIKRGAKKNAKQWPIQAAITKATTMRVIKAVVKRRIPHFHRNFYKVNIGAFSPDEKIPVRVHSLISQDLKLRENEFQPMQIFFMQFVPCYLWVLKTIDLLTIS